MAKEMCGGYSRLSRGRRLPVKKGSKSAPPALPLHAPRRPYETCLCRSERLQSLMIGKGGGASCWGDVPGGFFRGRRIAAQRLSAAKYRWGIVRVALSEIDRNLLQRCLSHKPRAWEDFVDRFLGLVVHVVNHTSQVRGIELTREDRDDLCAEVFLGIVQNDYAVLRNFRGHSSLATYLTVVARRTVVKKLIEKQMAARATGSPHISQITADPHPGPEERLADHEEVQRLLNGLKGTEAQVVRMYHLEGKSYREISSAVGVPENSIGPILARARAKMRQAGVHPTG